MSLSCYFFLWFLPVWPRDNLSLLPRLLSKGRFLPEALGGHAELKFQGWADRHPLARLCVVDLSTLIGYPGNSMAASSDGLMKHTETLRFKRTSRIFVENQSCGRVVNIISFIPPGQKDLGSFSHNTSSITKFWYLFR